MGWFTRKNEGIRQRNEVPTLPQLPDSNNNFDFSSMKRSNNEMSLPELPQKPIQRSMLPELPSSNKEKTMFPKKKPFMQSEYNFPEKGSLEPIMSSSTPRTFELPEIDESDQSPVAEQKPVQAKETEPIFVRLDKFKLTSDAFEDIKRKVKEIEALLEKTKEIKEKEQKELEEWEHEIQGLKSRMDSIDKNLFSKL